MLNTFNYFLNDQTTATNSKSAQILQSSDIDFVSVSYLLFGTEHEPMEKISSITDFVKTSSFSFMYIKHQSLGNEITHKLFLSLFRWSFNTSLLFRDILQAFCIVHGALLSGHTSEFAKITSVHSAKQEPCGLFQCEGVYWSTVDKKSTDTAKVLQLVWLEVIMSAKLEAKKRY